MPLLVLARDEGCHERLELLQVMSQRLLTVVLHTTAEDPNYKVKYGDNLHLILTMDGQKEAWL